MNAQWDLNYVGFFKQIEQLPFDAGEKFFLLWWSEISHPFVTSFGFVFICILSKIRKVAAF